VTDLGVVLPYWPGRPPLEALDVADAAASLGFAELWVGEMATFDAFALGAVIAGRCPRLPMTIGPLAVAVRDPVAFAMGVGTVAEVGGRTPGLALGASTPVVVEQWHGRSWLGMTARLRGTVVDVRALLNGEKVHGFRLRVATPAASITVAAFGDRSIAVAAELADRMVINLVTTEQAARLKAKVGDAIPLAAWVPVAIDPSDDTTIQLRQALVAYLGAPGYGEMFAAAGFGALVERARRGAHPRELFEEVGPELLDAVGAVGDIAHVRSRLADYRAAGVDHVAVVPGAVSDLTALATP
jgi:probable F420-dependent oxidoreductase